MNEDSFLIGSQCNAQRTTDSFRPVFVDQILADIKTGLYRNLVDQARRYRYEGNLEEAHAVEGSLPIIYPGADLTGLDNGDAIPLNGVAVVTMKLNSPLDADEALRHVRAWSFVKGYFTNVRGDVVILIWVGCDFSKAAEFRERRDHAVDMMNTALRKVHFFCRARSVRGIMAAYDPNCFIRPDSDLKAFCL